jgi:hypothetical protein
MSENGRDLRERIVDTLQTRKLELRPYENPSDKSIGVFLSLIGAIQTHTKHTPEKSPKEAPRRNGEDFYSELDFSPANPTMHLGIEKKFLLGKEEYCLYVVVDYTSEDENRIQFNVPVGVRFQKIGETNWTMTISNASFGLDKGHFNVPEDVKPELIAGFERFFSEQENAIN